MLVNLLPLGRVEKKYLKIIAKRIEKILGTKTKILEKMEIPIKTYDQTRKQFVSDLILEFLSSKFKDRTLAVIDKDLYTQGLNFVFGQAQLNGKVGIVSTFRLDPKFYGGEFDENLFLERLSKEAIHEIGHLFGLLHCNKRSCVMSFSNSIIEVDEKTMNLCEDCKNKLRKYGRESLGR